MNELWRALAVLCEPPRPELAAIADALELGALPSESGHTELFVFQMPPYAALYLNTENSLGGMAQDRAAGFWRALQLTPPAEPDHLAVLLAFYAECSTHADIAPHSTAARAWQRTQKALLWEHLLSWLPYYLLKLQTLAPPFYRAWANLVFEVLQDAARQHGPPDVVPLAWREPHAVPDPRTDGADAFMRGLLSFMRSGIILTRCDLQHAARELELGLRLGERRFMLQVLLEQDAPRVLRWLADVAAREAETVIAWLAPLDALRRVRLDATAKLLNELAATAESL